MDMSDGPEDFTAYAFDPGDRFDDCRPEMMPPPPEHGIDDLRSVSGEMDEEYERDDDYPFSGLI